MAGHGSFNSDGIFEARGGAAPASLRVERREWALQGERGARLYAHELVPAGGAGAIVALMHGYGEHCGRYDALAAELARRGHVVCLFDARGHGQSPGQRGHVRRYADYVADYRAFVRAARARGTRLARWSRLGTRTGP